MNKINSFIFYKLYRYYSIFKFFYIDIKLNYKDNNVLRKCFKVIISDEYKKNSII